MEMFTRKRSFERLPCQIPLNFTILPTQVSDSKKIQSTGSIIDVSEAGLGIVTEFPLEPGHVLEWDDKHQKGKLHIALVKWSQSQHWPTLQSRTIVNMSNHTQDEIVGQKQHQCPLCKEIIADDYIEQNPFPEIQCPSCGSLIELCLDTEEEAAPRIVGKEER